MRELVKLLASAFLGAASLFPVLMLISFVLALSEGVWGVDLFGAPLNGFHAGLFAFFIAYVIVIVYGVPVYFILKKIGKVKIQYFLLAGIVPSLFVFALPNPGVQDFLFLLVCCLTVSASTYYLMVQRYGKSSNKALHRINR
jgi:hypothetical protein